jgi:hypothetical protein
MCGVRALFFAWFLVWLGLNSTHAHLMSANKATFNIRSDAGYMVLSLPIQALTGLQLDEQGFINSQALPLQRELIEAQIRQYLQLSDTLGRTGTAFQTRKFDLLHINPSGGEHTPSAEQVLLFIRFPWDRNGEVPDGLQLRIAQWPPALQQLELDVIENGGVRDKHWLNADNPELVLRPTSMGIWWRFVNLGLTHIAEGLDHLLFLFLLLIARVSWKRWLLLLSGFTLAHAGTYSLVMLGHLSAPTAWIETLIAFTISCTALGILLSQSRHLRFRNSSTNHALGLEFVVIIAFGLIHGLGFASAVGTQGASTRYPMLSIFGFNVGIEFGQIVLAVVMALFLQLRRPLSHYGWKDRHSVALKTTCAVSGLSIGLVWLVQRWGQ